MRILFSMRSFWYVKTYDRLIQELARRGHQIHLVADFGDEADQASNQEYTRWNASAMELAERTPGLTWNWMPAGYGLHWQRVVTSLRLGLDYLRYRHPRYHHTPKLGVKAKRDAPAAVRALSKLPGAAPQLRRILTRLERLAPIDPGLRAYLESQAPDLLLVTPLITIGSPQSDLVRAARSLGIRTGVCVGSWDHLSSKALIRAVPDRLFVWNQVQRDEAVDFHGVPADRVVTTGAQCFDHWFTWQPSQSRESFLATVGLPTERPFLMYVCTSLLAGSPVEAEFVIEWAQVIRCHPALRDLSILVRPHPKRTKEWVDRRKRIEAMGNLVVWPRVGTPPHTDLTRNEYFDSLHYSAAVIGINTTAMIEAGIIGRPVLSVLLPEYRDNQEGTIHFHYLLNVGGGLLRLARTFDEHAAQIAETLVTGPPPNAAFIEAFVRPHGLDRPASHVFADAVEAMRSVPPLGPESVQAGDAAWRGLLRLVAPLFKVSYRALLLEERRLLDIRRRREGLTPGQQRALRVLLLLDAKERSKRRAQDLLAAERTKKRAERRERDQQQKMVKGVQRDQRFAQKRAARDQTVPERNA